MMRLMLTPINPATSWFSEVARIARPSRVKCTSSSRPPMIAADTSTIRICTSVMTAPRNSWRVGLMISGKV
jgi:hypothetical protein